MSLNRLRQPKEPPTCPPGIAEDGRTFCKIEFLEKANYDCRRLGFCAIELERTTQPTDPLTPPHPEESDQP